MINIMSVFLMSIQPFVIAPRPNVGPKLETVGPCQTRAWFSHIYQAQTPHGLDDQVVELIGVGAAADEGDTLAPVDRVAVRVLLHKRGIAGFLGPLGNFMQGIIPRNVLPVGRSWPPCLRLREPPRV